jgi:hypothetical protein
MPLHQPLLTTVCLACSMALSACAGDAPAAPTALAPPAATASLVVQVDTICAGRESNVRVFVDLVPIGVTNPGEPGVSQTVTVGSHQLSAVSQRGTQWGPFPTNVPDDGHLERLGCMPADGI